LLDDYRQQPDLSAADRIWANRNQAVLLAVRGEPTDRQQAIRLLTANPGQTSDDKRATAGILASLYKYLDGEERQTVVRKTIELLREIVPTSTNPRDTFGLVQALQANNNTAEAIAELQKLLNREPENVDYLLTALNILVESQQYDAAKPFIERIKGLAPTDFRVVALVARWECLRGQSENAVKLAATYERSGDATVAEPAGLVEKTAHLLAELAELPGVIKTPAATLLRETAVKKYDSLLANRPELLRPLCATLAAEGRTAEAMNTIEKQGKAISVTIRALAGIAVIRSGSSTPEMVQRVQTWLTEAQNREPSSLGLALANAEFLLAVGHLPDAESAYVAILQRDPANAMALNNLAWILAPQAAHAERALALVERAARETGLTAELLDTRARIRITAKQYAMAELDSTEALRFDKTALRFFHLALAKRESAATDSPNLQEARRRGLDAKTVHPMDVVLLQQLGL
jgi:tetratricopeptide (TPR) repeat protein